MSESITNREVTIKKSQQPARGQSPQKTFEKKKTILRINQVIWYVLGIFEVLLAFRVVLKMIGAYQSSTFTSFIYGITDPLALPFRGILGIFVSGNYVFEWPTLIAGVVYFCAAWGLVRLLDLVYPISPSDVTTE
ncbi:MAG: YggT family protein [Candidatus Pacebacteria bacterium]|nr:YggT family protein [Candidatus Paceibacterota bacterium]PIR63443.1 MAG: hypothetical protein COU64_04570 [Candidatus Pacebacteria bacterium CG10_big_fil_rev_8_21_14_0_10_40_26]PIZ79582.1 MAG: hypothetical protein COY01_00475 [Candidatus Pacebacteria bacterium CG_4_10_14_0_2_um_filter_40_20]PJA69035.1 MAG: hypothetical protein CO156_01725 [Candidatus Pacebacteria bacterium CG_4_9_14_3_um_filter_40_12]PJC41832.1 MAG: hypothetical protein CO041_03880 [Candidatus Pacebacteria bacterium CG_4_9_1